MNNLLPRFRRGSADRGRRMRFAAVASAGVLLSAMLAACGGGGQASGSGENTLIIGMTASDIPVLDTGLAGGQGYEGIRFVANQLYDSLTGYDLTQGDETAKIVPALAESWEPNKDLTVWTFHLREGVRFHDGEPWNADAAVFNLERYIDTGTPHYYPDLNAQSGLSISGIKSFKKVDDLTLEITTKSPWSYLPADLATVYFGSPRAIKELGNEEFALNPVGTGPFKFKSLERGQQLTMVANPDYWKGKPKVDTVILRPMPDSTARIAALRSGEVNWIEYPSPDDVPSLESEGYQVLTNSYDHAWLWVFDMTKPPFDDVKVRQAVNWAINRDALVKDILHDTAEPALQVVPRSNSAYREENDLYGYDVDKAKHLLEGAGYPDGFTMTLSYPTGGSGNMIPGPMNTALQADLAKVGIKVELKPIEWAALLTDYIAGKIPDDANALNFTPAFEKEGNWALAFGTNSTGNVGKYSNPEVDALLEKGKTVLDDTERSEVYAQATRLITEDAAVLTVVNDRNPRVLAENVKGFVQPMSWFADLTSITVE